MSIERVAAGLEVVGEILGRPTSDPDPDRQDWGIHSDVLDTLVRTAKDEVLEPVDDALAQLGDDPEQASRIRSVVADRLGDCAGLLLAANRDHDARALLMGSCRVAQSGPIADLSSAGLADTRRFTRIIRAWWLVHQDRRKDAADVARSILDGAPAPIAASAQQIIDASQPLSSPPALFGLNGFGLRVYGERDPRPNGTYVTTRYITALFVPLLPLDAFRVARSEDGDGWYFLAKSPLSTFTTWWRRLAALAVVVAIVWGGVSAYLGSVGYRMGEAMDAAQQAESDAGPEQLADVVDQYEAIIVEFADEPPETVEPAVEGFVRTAAATVSSPLTVPQLGQAKRVALRYRALPDVARHSTVVDTMLAQLEAWIDELGDGSPEAIGAAMELLGQQEAIAPSTQRTAITERRHGLNRTLAAGLAEQWPLEAIRQYASMPDDSASVTAAAALLDTLGEDHSVWVELSPTVARWERAAKQQPRLEQSRRVAIERVNAAQQAMDDPQRQALLAEPTLEALTAAVAQTPGDQEVAVALAQLQLAQGDAKAALATLDAIGPPGRMVLAAQAALASIYADNGQEAEADALLGRVLTSRLPAFESARRAYTERADSLSDTLVARARQGRLPPALRSRMESASEAKQQEMFSQWLDEQVTADPELVRLRDEYTTLSGVVGVAIQWGTIKLQRANRVQGEQRQQLLDGAEQAFLSISSHGAGIPSYHLGLGRVYYRLGKEQEAEREFTSLLDDEPPEVQLGVASAYRELGLTPRAREVATAVYEASEPPVKHSAAVLMAMMATDSDEGRTWLQRGDTSSPAVKLRLMDYEAEDKLKQGDYAGADATYARVAEQWLAQSDHSSAAFNNAALAMLDRYRCTGTVDRLREAVRALDQARSLEPDSALVVGNLASVLEMLASIELLEPYMQLQLLRLEGTEIQKLLGAVITGPYRDRLRASIKSSQSVRRMLDLQRQQLVLGPKRPDAYASLALWYRRTQDQTALEELNRTLEGVELDLTDARNSHAGFLDGSTDADRVEALQRRLTHYDAVETGLGRKAKPATRAGLLLLRAEIERSLALTQLDLVSARGSLERFAQAHQQWDGLDSESHADALVDVALLQARTESKALEKAYDDRFRRLGAAALLGWIADDGGEALTALRAQPELREAAVLRAGLHVDRLDAFDWMLGLVTANDELSRASRTAVARPHHKLYYVARTKLEAGPEGVQLLLDRLDR